MHPIRQHRSTTVQSTSNGSIRFRFMEEEESATASISNTKTSSTSSPLKRRRAEQKRVVSLPAADVDRSLAKGERAPPSDSWTWRKYGQKPIKGSPYPRGYYRCSTSKGCPAKKQVERSSADSTVLVITYAGEHNHPSPAFRSSTSSRAPAKNLSPEIGPAVLSGLSESQPEVKFADVGSEASVLLPDDLGWLSDVASCTSCEVRLENPVLAGSCDAGADMEALLRPMREEEESMFADLGELPECSMVFPRGFCESRRCTLASAPW